MKRIDFSNYLDALQQRRQPWQQGYYAMYSSVLGGVVRDPLLMQVPLDDHLVHRGDGVFDTFKCVGRAAYNLEAHLQRLLRSASSIGLSWPDGIDGIRALTVETLAEAGREVCSGRVMISRGPGSFGVSPYESPAPALYIVVYAAGVPFMVRHPEGARVRRSQVPVKPARFATVKHCNYLPNVLMKREAVDWGVDFVVGFDDDGLMAEGATENFGIVTRAGELLFPRVETVLDGTTMLRVMQLAEPLAAEGALRAIGFRDITEADVRDAAEMLVVGTTINVVSVREFEGVPIADGRPGKIGQTLNDLLTRDIETNAALRTVY
ncbi:MAG TPA: aminotransferase class IV [Kiritimatiellia bacterium]|nr:aminotransferase class IV [Kiritimatiellia bacterium]HPC48616.1 aminotransferase class IV [Kiritimatiellia bacterium]HPK37238.1 aminotransferase class IV [Kiritimatiellia bacterium]HPW74839.1 aminotransferase class IV [Kiritimatiellia bacterium]HRU20127.1 aminotransferase class IV [Kiritimatiellia bacterium]